MQGGVILTTGLSGSGKTTLCDYIYNMLHTRGNSCKRLDGDVARTTFSKNLGFSKKDRNTNIKRVGAVASYLESEGFIVLASFIAPDPSQRKFIKNLCNNFIEIYISTPLEICEKRDPKGLYKLAREGKIKSFTGLHEDAPYIVPVNPDITIDTRNSIEVCAKEVISYLENVQLI
jgi:adenylylsulfate kinase